MAKKTVTKPWRDFELGVAELYQELGATEIAHDINIGGSQIDVYAVVPSYDGSYIKTIISCKHYTGVVGVGAVREWNQVFQPLFTARQADSAVIVSKDGFTQDAQLFAKQTGVRLVTIDRLRWASCDFTPYLRAKNAEFASEDVFRMKRYVPLRLRFDGEATAVDAHEATCTFLTAANQSLLILLGDFGAGKTTFTKHLFQSLATAFLSDPGKARMPIYINLREYPGHLNLSSLVTDLLVNQYRARCPGFSSIERLHREGKLVVIFDAFDEMASRTDYQTTLQNFNAVERLLIGKGKTLLACRTHYFKDQEEVTTVYGGTELYKLSRQNRYRLCYLQGFEPQQIEAYVKAVSGDESQLYLKQIKETYNLEGLAQRPILLDMITEVLPTLVKRRQEVNSATLYSVYVDFWLRRDDWRTTLSKEERLKFTSAFANGIYDSGADVFKWEDVEKAIRARWPESSKKEIEYYQYDIRTCTFIRWAPGTGEYKFVHQSFMEYFVAFRLYESIIHDDKSALSARAHTEGVLHFLSELKGTQQACDTIERWLRWSPSESLIRNAFAVLARWRPALEGQRFSHVRLRDYRLTRFEFVESGFTSCELADSIFMENKWRQCKIFGTKIVNCAWTNCSLQQTSFERCAIRSTAFRQASLDQTTFANCELTDLELTCNGTACAFNSCRFTRCDWRGWVGSGVIFINCSFTDVVWSVESLSGALFDQGNFVSNAEGLLLAQESKQGRLWKHAPTFFKVKGIDADVRRTLRLRGAIFPRPPKTAGKRPISKVDVPS